MSSRRFFRSKDPPSWCVIQYRYCMASSLRTEFTETEDDKTDQSVDSTTMPRTDPGCGFHSRGPCKAMSDHVVNLIITR